MLTRINDCEGCQSFNLKLICFVSAFVYRLDFCVASRLFENLLSSDILVRFIARTEFSVNIAFHEMFFHYRSLSLF